MAAIREWQLLRWVREFRGYTQADVSAAVKQLGGRLSLDHLSRLERGEKIAPSYQTVQAWLEVLEVPMGALDVVRSAPMSETELREFASGFVFQGLSQLSDRELRQLVSERYGAQ